MSKSPNGSKSFRSEQEIVEQEVVGAMRRRCVESLHGLTSGAPRLSILTDLEELRGMTRCDEHPHGLDFSTDEHSARGILYAMREEMQSEYGLYFIGERRVGIKWSCFGPRGLAWRIGEFFERATPLAGQCASFASIEAGRTANKSVARKIAKVAGLLREAQSTLREIQSETDGVLSVLPGVLLNDDEDGGHINEAAD